MFRQCVTAVLLFSYLATGLASVPHVHASQPDDHGARPHVHFDWISGLFAMFADPSNGYASHYHVHHGRQHNDLVDRHGHSDAAPCDEPDGTPEPIRHDDQDHDSTCMYIADHAQVIVPAAGVADLIRVFAHVAIFDFVPEDIGGPMLFPPERTHPPPDSLVAGFDLILKLRTLRI